MATKKTKTGAIVYYSSNVLADMGSAVKKLNELKAVTDQKLALTDEQKADLSAVAVKINSILVQAQEFLNKVVAVFNDSHDIMRAATGNDMFEGLDMGSSVYFINDKHVDASYSCDGAGFITRLGDSFKFTPGVIDSSDTIKSLFKENLQPTINPNAVSAEMERIAAGNSQLTSEQQKALVESTKVKQEAGVRTETSTVVSSKITYKKEV